MRFRGIGIKCIWLVVTVLILSNQCAFAKKKPWPQPFGPIESREQFIKDHFQGRKLADVEGIWLDDGSRFEVAIVKNVSDMYKDYDYVGIVITYKDKEFEPGDLKLALKESGDRRIFPGICFNIKHIDLGHSYTYIQRTPAYMGKYCSGDFESSMIRMYPKEGENPASEGSTFSGTGFFVAKDLVLTNWHVVDGCNDIKITLSTGKEAKAEIAVKDTINDLALLKIKDLENAPSPLALGVPRNVKPGDKAYTIGFPLPDEMGVQAKVSEGIINSTSGMDDDPRMFQISIPVQPGNSGGPLLNTKGEVIGVVTAGLNNVYLLVKKETLSQNVNYAMKISYLDPLLGMLPEAPKLAEIKNTEEMEASQIMEKLRPGVVLVTAKGGEDKKEEPEEK